MLQKIHIIRKTKKKKKNEKMTDRSKLSLTSFTIQEYSLLGNKFYSFYPNFESVKTNIILSHM